MPGSVDAIRRSRQTVSNFLLIVAGALVTAGGGTLLLAEFPTVTAPFNLDLARHVVLFTSIGLLPWLAIAAKTPEATAVSAYLFFLGGTVPMLVFTDQLTVVPLDLGMIGVGLLIGATVWFASSAANNHLTLVVWLGLLVSYVAVLGYLVTLLVNAPSLQVGLVAVFTTGVMVIAHGAFLKERTRAIEEQPRTTETTTGGTA